MRTSQLNFIIDNIDVFLREVEHKNAAIFSDTQYRFRPTKRSNKKKPINNWYDLKRFNNTKKGWDGLFRPIYQKNISKPGNLFSVAILG